MMRMILTVAALAAALGGCGPSRQSQMQAELDQVAADRQAEIARIMAKVTPYMEMCAAMMPNASMSVASTCGRRMALKDMDRLEASQRARLEEIERRYLGVRSR